MTALADLPVVGQPYPGVSPWLLLSSYVTNQWQAGSGGSSFHLIGRVDHNEAHLKMRTRFGVDRVITGELPEEFCPARQQVLPISATGYPDMQVIIEPTGQMMLFSGSGAHGPASDGSLSNAVLHCSYLRKP